MKKNQGQPGQTPEDLSAEAATLTRAQRELAMWHKWNQGGRSPEDLEPLLKSYDTTIAHKARQFAGGAALINQEAIKAELGQHLINAAHSYDPTMNVPFHAYVEPRFQKAQRWRNDRQNVLRLSEPNARQIAPIQRAMATLQEQFGRDPTHEEIAAEAGMTPKAVARIMPQIKRDINASAFESDPSEGAIPRYREVAPLLRPQFEQPEFQHEQHLLPMFDHLYGLNGKPRIESGNELAKTLNISPSKVSQLRKLIELEAKKFM